MLFHLCGSSFLDSHSFYFMYSDFVGAPVVQLSGAGAGVIGHRGGFLKSAAVFQVSRDPGRSKGVIPDLRLDSSGGRATLHHGVGVNAG